MESNIKCHQVESEARTHINAAIDGLYGLIKGADGNVPPADHRTSTAVEFTIRSAVRKMIDARLELDRLEHLTRG